LAKILRRLVDSSNPTVTGNEYSNKRSLQHTASTSSSSSFRLNFDVLCGAFVRVDYIRVDYIRSDFAAFRSALTAACNARGLVVAHSASLGGSISPHLCARKLTLMIFESVIKTFDSITKIFDTIAMTFESSVKIFDAAITKIFDSTDMVFAAAADMVFDAAADMVFVTAVAKKFDLFIVKKFDPCVMKKFDPAVAVIFDPAIVMIFDHVCINLNHVASDKAKFSSTKSQLLFTFAAPDTRGLRLKDMHLLIL
jgi:hypothetical protein